MQFKFYVLNYDFNRKKVENFNIFQNCSLNDATEKEVKKYIRSSQKYKYDKSNNETLYGFGALCEKIRSLIMWQEWSRCEYEIAVGEMFTAEVKDVLRDANEYIKDGKSLLDFKEHLEKVEQKTRPLEKWDCYQQALPNIEIITREVIYQYKKQHAGEKK